MTAAVDTHGHAGAPAHHDPPEVVAARQGLGVWLFIGGDVVVFGALMFAFFYLRGLNVQNYWMPAGIHPNSSSIQWATAAFIVVAAALIWAAEKAVRSGSKSASALSFVGALCALGAAGFAVDALKSAQFAVNNNNFGTETVGGSYQSIMIAINSANLIHFLLLAFLGLGLAIRMGKGLISAERPTHAYLVRIFWVWVALSTVIGTALTVFFAHH
jgi:cytochrome c oxidase subunit III